MKIRIDFVTNSSSSSYIVISHNEKDVKIPNLSGCQLKIGEIGDTEFGWDETWYGGFHTRLNFAMLIAEYFKEQHPEWVAMLYQMVKINTKCESIENIIVDDCTPPRDKIWGYIDHQSVDMDNADMFSSQENLFSFLFNEKSGIQGGNDNS